MEKRETKKMDAKIAAAIKRRKRKERKEVLAEIIRLSYLPAILAALYYGLSLFSGQLMTLEPAIIVITATIVLLANRERASDDDEIPDIARRLRNSFIFAIGVIALMIAINGQNEAINLPGPIFWGLSFLLSVIIIGRIFAYPYQDTSCFKMLARSDRAEFYLIIMELVHGSVFSLLIIETCLHFGSLYVWVPALAITPLGWLAEDRKRYFQATWFGRKLFNRLSDHPWQERVFWVIFFLPAAIALVSTVYQFWSQELIWGMKVSYTAVSAGALILTAIIIKRKTIGTIMDACAELFYLFQLPAIVAVVYYAISLALPEGRFLVEVILIVLAVLLPALNNFGRYLADSLRDQTENLLIVLMGIGRMMWLINEHNPAVDVSEKTFWLAISALLFTSLLIVTSNPKKDVGYSYWYIRTSRVLVYGTFILLVTETCLHFGSLYAWIPSLVTFLVVWTAAGGQRSPLSVLIPGFYRHEKIYRAIFYLPIAIASVSTIYMLWPLLRS